MKDYVPPPIMPILNIIRDAKLNGFVSGVLTVKNLKEFSEKYTKDLFSANPLLIPQETEEHYLMYMGLRSTIIENPQLEQEYFFEPVNSIE